MQGEILRRPRNRAPQNDKIRVCSGRQIIARNVSLGVILNVVKNLCFLVFYFMKKYYVYILTNASKNLYSGMTNDLERRMYEHKQKKIPGFTKRYNLSKLAYFEETSDVKQAISREK